MITQGVTHYFLTSEIQSVAYAVTQKSEKYTHFMCVTHTHKITGYLYLLWVEWSTVLNMVSSNPLTKTDKCVGKEAEHSLDCS